MARYWLFQFVQFHSGRHWSYCVRCWLLFCVLYTQFVPAFCCALYILYILYIYNTVWCINYDWRSGTFPRLPPHFGLDEHNCGNPLLVDSCVGLAQPGSLCSGVGVTRLFCRIYSGFYFDLPVTMPAFIPNTLLHTIVDIHIAYVLHVGYYLLKLHTYVGFPLIRYLVIGVVFYTLWT